MTDAQIRAAVAAKELSLDPFDPSRVEPASYDIRAGTWGFTSSLKEKVDLSRRGLLVIEAGEFAVIESRERIQLDDRTAGQLGLRSEYAQRGLLMLSGPQIDPGFEGILVVRLVNLSPKSIAVPYEEPLLTTQFFRLSERVAKPYSGPRQRQTGITGKDIQELVATEGMTLGGVIKMLTALAKDVSELRGSVGRLSWSIPLIVGLGIGVVAIITALK